MRALTVPKRVLTAGEAIIQCVCVVLCLYGGSSEKQRAIQLALSQLSLFLFLQKYSLRLDCLFFGWGMSSHRPAVWSKSKAFKHCTLPWVAASSPACSSKGFVHGNTVGAHTFSWSSHHFCTSLVFLWPAVCFHKNRLFYSVLSPVEMDHHSHWVNSSCAILGHPE